MSKSSNKTAELLNQIKELKKKINSGKAVKQVYVDMYELMLKKDKFQMDLLDKCCDLLEKKAFT